MRSTLVAAASVLALAIAGAPAMALAAPSDNSVAAASEEVSDAQLIAFNEAMQKVRAVAAAAGSSPTPEQQAEMAAAIEASGLAIDQFNAVSSKVSTDGVLRARLGVLSTPESAAGSAAAGVSDEEVAQFSAAMARIRDVAPAGGAAPSADQQAAMAAAVANSGLELERFNAIATAVSQDARLRARVELADARRG